MIAVEKSNFRPAANEILKFTKVHTTNGRIDSDSPPSFKSIPTLESRLPNKRRPTLIAFWDFFQGLWSY